MRSVITFAVVLPLLLSFAGCERAKTKMDREVDRLCAIDGGVHIYETVTLAKEDFGPDGEVFPQYRGRLLTDGRYGPDYALVSNNKRLASESPFLSGYLELKRINTQFIRVSDKKILGERVIYGRRGGDFYGPAEPSGYSCPEGILDLEGHVFKAAE